MPFKHEHEIQAKILCIKRQHQPAVKHQYQTLECLCPLVVTAGTTVK